MIVSFNGTAVTPDPSECTVSVQDISSADSGRSSSNATMQKVVIAQKRTLHVGWNGLTRAEANTICQLLESGSNPVYVSVTYDGDPILSGTQTKTFYHGDISAAFQECWVGNRKRYSKLTFDLIEV